MNPWADGNDSDDDGSDKKTFESVRDNMVFLIDCSPKMLEPMSLTGEEEEKTTGLQIALDVLEKMMKQKIMAHPDDKIGVVFFNAKVAHNEHHFVGVNQFLPLDISSSATIEKIAQFKLLLDGRDLSKFHSKMGCLDLTDNENSLGDALWFTDSSIRSSNLRPQDGKRVLIFTKSDAPFGNSTSSTETRAMSRASDMGGGGVQVELWHLNPLSQEDASAPTSNQNQWFHLNRFYQQFLDENLKAYRKHIAERNIEVIERDDVDPLDLQNKTYIDCTMDCTDPEAAHQAAMTRWVTKRTLKSINLFIGSNTNSDSNGSTSSSSSSSSFSNSSDTLTFSMKAYALLRPASKPAAKKIDGRTNEAVRSETVHLCNETGTFLEKHQISTYFLFGKTDRAIIKTSEIDAIKQMKQPSGIRILGFKPAASILPMHQIRNPTFLYPDDENLQGSTAALAALHRRMLVKNVVAICGVKIHARSAERLGAMVAQQEIVDPDDERHQQEPPGFQIIFLPFADDIRQITRQYFDREQATATQIAAAGQIINNTMIPHYSASVFDNPELAKHFAALQALAMYKEIDFTEAEDDLVHPDYEGQKEYTEPYVKTFVETLPQAVVVEKKKAASKKRKAPASKMSEAESKQAKVDMEEINKNGTLKKQSVARLKTFLKSQGKPVGGKKGELVERIQAMFA